MTITTLSIAAIDEKLALLRQGYLDAKPEKQGEWRRRIDQALDMRLELMQRQPVCHSGLQK
jgi:hypothetical protein